MNNTEAFFLVAFLYWIAFERLVEVIRNRFFGSKKNKSEQEAILKKNLGDAFSTALVKAVEDITITPAEKKILDDGVASFKEISDKYLPAYNKILNYNSSDSSKIALLTYLIAFCCAIVFYFSGYTLFTALGKDQLITISIQSIDFIITTLVFAGGPDLLHQVISLITEQKEKIKINN